MSCSVHTHIIYVWIAVCEKCCVLRCVSERQGRRERVDFTLAADDVSMQRDPSRTFERETAGAIENKAFVPEIVGTDEGLLRGQRNVL